MLYLIDRAGRLTRHGLDVTQPGTGLRQDALVLDLHDPYERVQARFFAALLHLAGLLDDDSFAVIDTRCQDLAMIGVQERLAKDE